MTDNRPPQVRFLDDIQDLARMASITEPLIEQALRRARPCEGGGGDVIILMRNEMVENVCFAITDILKRAESLAARCGEMEQQIDGSTKDWPKQLID